MSRKRSWIFLAGFILVSVVVLALATDNFLKFLPHVGRRDKPATDQIAIYYKPGFYWSSLGFDSGAAVNDSYDIRGYLASSLGFKSKEIVDYPAAIRMCSNVKHEGSFSAAERFANSACYLTNRGRTLPGKKEADETFALAHLQCKNAEAESTIAEQQLLPKIKTGTTRNEVIQILGMPNRIDVRSRSEWLIYYVYEDTGNAEGNDWEGSLVVSPGHMFLVVTINGGKVSSVQKCSIIDVHV